MEKDYVVQIPVNEPSNSTESNVSIDLQSLQMTSAESTQLGKANDDGQKLPENAGKHLTDSGFVHQSTGDEYDYVRAKPASNKGCRLYFQSEPTENPQFRAITTFLPAVTVAATSRYTRWTGNTEDAGQVDARLFNIILGVSLEHLNLELIESISFSSGPGQSYAYGPLETFKRAELKELSMYKERVLRLGLHRQYITDGPLAVEMEIRTTLPDLSVLDPGFVELHYMELSIFQVNPVHDPTLHIHRPYQWSIDVAHSGCSENNPSSARSAFIMHHSISGDNKFAATLSVLNNWLQLDLWDLELEQVSAATEHPVDAPAEISPKPPFCPRPCSQMRWALQEKIYPAWTPFMVSLSWNASKVAVVSKSSAYLQDTLQLFQHKRVKGFNSEVVNTLTPFKESQLMSELKGVCKSGKFHIIADKGQDPNDELFIACDGASVSIYSVRGSWSHIRTIQLLCPSEKANPRLMIDHNSLMDGLRSRYFSWTNQQRTLLICNLATGQLVCRIPDGRGAAFSSDGSMVAIRHAERGLTTRWTESGIVLASMEDALSNPVFIPGDSNNLLMPLISPDESFGRAKLGALLDSSTLSVNDSHIFSVPAPHLSFRHDFTTYAGAQSICFRYGSKLDVLKLDDLAVKAYHLPRAPCTLQCKSNLTKIAVISPSRTKAERTSTMPTGLTFTVFFTGIKKNDWSDHAEKHSIVISVSQGAATIQKALEIPAPSVGDIEDHWLNYTVIFDTAKQEMLLFTSIFAMIWKLPKLLGGAFSLVLMWWLQPIPFQLNPRIEWCWTSVSQCPDRQYYITTWEYNQKGEEAAVESFPVYSDNAFTYASSLRCLEGILVLIEMSRTTDGAFKQAIFQYVGHYINTYPNVNNHSESIMAKICQSVTQDNYQRYNVFLKEMLDSANALWIPRPDHSDSTNPLCILLHLTEKLPRAIDIVETLIHYCTRMAKSERDLQFILPLMDPIHTLLQQKHLYTDVIRRSLQCLEFIPAKDRPHLIHNHLIAHAPTLRQHFWKPNNQPLYECTNPVLQLDRRPSIREVHEPLNETFTPDLFVASFDMLWQAPQLPSETQAYGARKTVTSWLSHSWIYMVLHMMWASMRSKSGTSVKCNEFDLESLDNPAIVALVEYKWNTIGFTYWFLRFLSQCCYYLLVLIAVFSEVYDGMQRSHLASLFIAIITLSLIFLWLEFVQLIHDWRRYLSSPYNYADVIAFAVPLAGSIIQLKDILSENKDGEVYILSFSVLCVLLHLLFELRINKTVCQFVTIIVRIMSRIRVFFLVFAAGIVAFTVAILHLLHGCSTNDCMPPETKFPRHFYLAFSSTYFFMGGRYDPISDDFLTDNWAFHTMMIIYFFFTAILLLNVLIALINVAFSLGDDTWRLVWLENRLGYVESAENLSYRIPGYRQMHDYFPKEIYYSATIQQVRAYQSKRSRDLDDGNTHTLFGQGSSAQGVTSVAMDRSVMLSQQLLRDYEEQRIKQAERDKDHQRIIEGLKKEQHQCQSQLSALQDQLKEQQNSFENQIKELKVADMAELKELKNLLSSFLKGESKVSQ